MTTTQFNLKLNKALHALQEHLENINHNYLLEGEEERKLTLKDYLLHGVGTVGLATMLSTGMGGLGMGTIEAGRQLNIQAELVKEMFDDDLVKATNTDIIQHKYKMNQAEFETWMNNHPERVRQIVKRKLQQGTTEQGNDIIFKILSQNLTKDPDLSLRYK